MAEDIGNNDSQVNACNIFVENLVEVPINDNKIDITRWDANSVIGLLKAIVNDKEKYTTNSTFNLEIKRTSAQTKKTNTICFQLKANPTKHQPGNGMITNMNTNQSPTHEQLSTNLTKVYENDTCLFAKDIKAVFAKNSRIFKVPEVTRDAYMILLFEIGRRLVKTDKSSTEKKKSYDKLPIASAITRLVKLMEERKCTFEQVFSVDGEFHCFTGGPDEREIAILNINDHHALNEIKQMFGPGQTETQTGLEARVQGLSLDSRS